MKQCRFIIFSIVLSLLGCFSLKAETVVFNSNMSETEASETPYILDVNHNKDTKTIEIDFTLNALFFKDSQIPGAMICYLPDFTSESETGMPILPSKTFKYNLPTCDSVSIQILNVTTQEFNRTIAPAQEPIADQESTPDILTSVIDYPGYYPENVCGQSDIQFYRGLPIHYITIAPVMYNVRDNKLKVTTSFKAIISYNEGVADREPQRSNAFKSQRANQLDKICSGGIWDEYDAKPYPEPNTEDYLIISSVKSAGATDSLADWKRTMGYNVKTVHTPSMTWEEMQDTIRYYYENLDNLTYVLIFDHYNLFPGIPFEHLGATSYYDRPGAMSYSAYGLMDGEGDLIPEFYVGRVHIDPDSTHHIIDFIEKVKTYESTPPVDPYFYKSAFLAGRFEPKYADYNWQHPDKIPLSTSHIEDYNLIRTLERLRPVLLNNGINARRIYNRHPFMIQNNVWPSQWTTDRRLPVYEQSDIPFLNEIKYPNFLWDGGKDDIIDALSEGSFLGIYFSHGNSMGWYPLDFYPSDCKTADIGTRYPLLLSISCGTGMHQWNGSFANALSILKEGPIALFASTEISYCVENEYLLEGLLKTLFPDSTSIKYGRDTDPRLGQLLNYGLSYCESKSKNESCNLHQRASYCCYGDPSVVFHTDVPVQFNAPFLQGCGSDIYVDLIGEDYINNPIKLHFYDRDSGKVESYDYIGPNYYFQASNKSSEVEVAITGHNRYPYFETVEVAYGESFFPKIDGKINSFTYNSASGMIDLNVEVSGAIPDYIIRFTAANDTTQSFDNMILTFVNGEEPCTFNIGAGFKGIFQVQLIYDSILLDTYRGIIN